MSMQKCLINPIGVQDTNEYAKTFDNNHPNEDTNEYAKTSDKYGRMRIQMKTQERLINIIGKGY